MTITTLTGNPHLVDSGFDSPPYNPLHLLQNWLDMADRLEIIEPRGLVLSTLDGHGIPSSRVVLLKSVDETGVIFASSAVSQKGKDLEINPRAAGTLWWRETVQQINFQGKVTKLSPKVSDAIFEERTREAQAVAVLSCQSQPLIDEETLRENIIQLICNHDPIQRPHTWHAYHIALESIEFWHGSADRFHNRLRYDLRDEIWECQRLQP